MEQRNARESEYQRKSNEADASGKPLDMTQFQATGAFAQASIARLRSEKGRSVTSYWLLHSVGEAQQVAAVEFAAVGDSLLGSLVLAESGRLASFDMPANRKDLESHAEPVARRLLANRRRVPVRRARDGRAGRVGCARRAARVLHVVGAGGPARQAAAGEGRQAGPSAGSEPLPSPGLTRGSDAFSASCQGCSASH